MAIPGKGDYRQSGKWDEVLSNADRESDTHMRNLTF
jgi:hypothetical protein